MKTLYLMRHAKSSWKQPELSDFDRPLNKRGKRDVPFIAKLLRDMGVKPDVIMTSPTMRALSTAKILTEELKYPREKIVVNDLLYEGGKEELVEVIRATDRTIGKLMMVGHNPALTEVVNYFSPGVENIPTCGIVCLEFNLDSWKQVDQNRGKLKFFEYPKKYFD